MSLIIGNQEFVGITLNGVTGVVHLPQSTGLPEIEEDVPEGSPANARITYLCNWKQRYDFARGLVGGYPQVISGGFIFPAAPHFYPPSPNLYCSALSIRPLANEIRKGTIGNGFDDEDDMRWNACRFGLVRATYRAPDMAFDASMADETNQIDPSTPILYCRQRVRANNTFITLENARLRFLNSGKVIETNDGLPANTCEFVLEFPRLRYNPTMWFNQFLGRLNAFPMFGLPPGHILFSTYETDTSLSLFGTENSASLTLSGSLDVGWNERVNDTGEPEPVVFINGAKPPFESTNLFGIFAA